MVAGGLPERSDDHCERVALFALEMVSAMREESLRTSTGEKVALRIGLHTGAAVAGVIGTSKFSYDLWGDTVNTASRMESHGEAGKIHVSEEVYALLHDKFTFEERGEIEVKGKGVMRTWYLVGTRQR
jgi:adenylate cyclase